MTKEQKIILSAVDKLMKPTAEHVDKLKKFIEENPNAVVARDVLPGYISDLNDFKELKILLLEEFNK